MLTSVPGVYRDGKVQLAEEPRSVPSESRVIVTFLDSGAVDLRERAIDEAGASMLRAQLETFGDDWDSPAMSVYDDYDGAKGAP